MKGQPGAVSPSGPPAGSMSQSGGMTPPAGMGSGAPASMGGGPDQEAAGPAGAERPSLEMPVLYVTSVEIVRTSVSPRLDIIRVEGLTGSQGWSAPQLVPFYYGKPADNMLDLQFVATSPVQSQKATGYTRIGAIFTLEEGHPFTGVRIRASANAIEVKTIPGVVQTAIKTDGCADCIGKKFAAKGQAPAGQPGVVRAEDLPRGFRVIEPSHGVAGITHNPNRLNLILGDDNKIVEAFWE
jgi:hypothetical protein